MNGNSRKENLNENSKKENSKENSVLEMLRPDFESIGKYLPVKPLDVLADEIGVPVEKLIKLDANENLYGPLAEGIVSFFSFVSLPFETASYPSIRTYIYSNYYYYYYYYYFCNI